VLLAHENPGALPELDVLPGKPGGLGDPQPGMREELEEQPPLLGELVEKDT
jgi:hypothetical protein